MFLFLVKSVLVYHRAMTPDDTIENTFRLALPQKKALERLGLRTIRDLLYHFPARYITAEAVRPISELIKGDNVTVFGKITKLRTGKAFRKKIPLAEGRLFDGTGKIRIVWFHQPFIAKTFAEDSFVKITGKVGENKAGLYFSNPEIKHSSEAEARTGLSLFENRHNLPESLAVYPETRGISSRWFAHAIAKIVNHEDFKNFEDPLPEAILLRYHLPPLGTALRWMHSPRKERNSVAARKRFAFEEIFFIQLARLKTKKNYEAHSAFPISTEKERVDGFVQKFPFAFTGAQKRALSHILHDMSRGHPMMRLLEGDVGSGKTAVAAAAVYAVVNSRPRGKDFGNLNAAYMVPTEILAKQHFESFIGYFRESTISVGLITGSECRKFPSKTDPSGYTSISRNQLSKWVANGEIPVIVGTHALIQKDVVFKNLALVIIDEQHRFGVTQRARLAGKKEDGRAPHLLSMTATPIPRTLALTVYGDLDLTLIDEMPPGRKEIVTDIITPSRRKEVYEAMRERIRAGRQAYIICPRIDEPDPERANALRAKSAKAEEERLKREIFPEFRVGLIHGKLKKDDKNAVMKEFLDGNIHILVATSVVEVGVNVPNATMIVIEGAERFGLAQLHQLRGRVLRSTHQAYCYLFSDTRGSASQERLRALKNAKSGFELAELDLAMRGEGSLSGTAQWGVSDVGMDAIKNIKMVEAARIEAQKIIEKDPSLSTHPIIRENAERRAGTHFE